MEGSGGERDNQRNDDERRLSPTEAFSLLGESARVDIVTTLHQSSDDTPLSFSSLYDRVAIDGTGRFNYHLDELVGHFVTKTEGKYRLSAAGLRVARSVAAGTYTDTPSVAPVDIKGNCYACDAAALEASYDDERFRIHCQDCGQLVLAIRVPPSLARKRDPTAFVDAVERWSRSQVNQVTRGLCPECGGVVEPSVTDDIHESISFPVVAAFDCPVCGRRTMTSFGAIAAQDDAVRQFHRQRDASLRDRRYWEIDQFVTGEDTEIVATDPWLVAVEFSAGDDVCRVEIDGELTVVEVDVHSSDGE